jgi:hypothetical protein
VRESVYRPSAFEFRPKIFRSSAWLSCRRTFLTRNAQILVAIDISSRFVGRFDVVAEAPVKTDPYNSPALRCASFLPTTFPETSRESLRHRSAQDVPALLLVPIARNHCHPPHDACGSEERSRERERIEATASGNDGRLKNGRSRTRIRSPEFSN